GDGERMEMLEGGALGNTRYLDVELETLRRGVGRPGGEGTQVIVSSHDFVGRPERLHNIVLEMNGGAGDVNKIVWTARTIRDNLEAFEILQSRQKPTIAICMGEAGLISRVLAKKFGGLLSFASLKEGKGTAAGQVSLADMKRLYRWDAMGPATKVYGVVGSPVGHSMSPAIHNACFEQVGWDGVYLPLLVEGSYESFKAFMETFLNFEGMNLSGLSVTIPHKENALRYLVEKGAVVEELAVRIGAVNTIVVEESGKKLRGMNTDYGAILDSITSKMGVTRDGLKGIRVGVLGAGGTGRTAVAGLAACGATVVVYNRTREKAEALATEFNGKSGKVVAAPLEKVCDSCCQVWVNTTSVGMYPKVDESPMVGKMPKMDGETVVLDTVYNPMRTRFLQEAEAAGARTIGGIEMFVRQAAAQFEVWTGVTAPRDLMRQVVEGRLGAKSG
ncbi:MAG TPA: shikimate dehydrogenase, partial [Tepidisphaeraceae bacterium]|nr:shikimate dehydrogenase [Tepidisphaeraceae bacterium]